ncbi:MAG TPA: HEAT repeat domain-containing protein [Acidimicrobiia bacterium]
MTKVDEHRKALAALDPREWRGYLAANSNLPGPRGNLELVEAFADLAEPGLIRALAAADDEYEATCGAAGLGRLLAEGDPQAADELRALATDGRWRVREGVAMALQRLGDADMDGLVALVTDWAAGPSLVQRAAAAGICEPRLLRTADAARAALDLIETITSTFASLPPSRRADADVRTLRQALGYCWSVAVAAAPAHGFTRLEWWATTDDPDVGWILRENLKKKRLERADAARLDALRAIVEAAGRPRA